MRCQALPSRARPDHPYHRIYDCLLPIAHYLEVVAQAPDKRRICLIGSATSVFPFVRPLLSGVIEDQLAQLRMIDQHNPCVRSLRIVPQLRRYPPNHLANQLTLRHYLGRIGATDPPMDIVLVTRTGAREFGAQSPGSSFLDGTGMAARLGRAGRKVVTYRGDASILDTIRLFAGAAAVVGYHGAGVTNSLFMPNQACVTEMSAYCDAEHRTVWRNCGECVTQWTPWLRWKLHKIPFRDMLEANGLAPTATVPADRDSWLKNLLYVGVRPEEMGRIVEDVHACLEGLPGGAGPANLAHNERGNRGMSSAELMQPQERCPGTQPRPVCWDGMQGPPWCRGVQPPKVQ
jgi:hypothetical protein